MIGIRGDGSSRAGLARCGYTRLGWHPPAPTTRSLIRAVAELVRNQDCHEPIRPDDIDKIVAMTMKGAR